MKKTPFFVEDVYNKKGLHSALDYRSPEEYEKLSTEHISQEGEVAKTLFV